MYRLINRSAQKLKCKLRHDPDKCFFKIGNSIIQLEKVSVALNYLDLYFFYTGVIQFLHQT